MTTQISARERLEAYMAHESDADAAEYSRRLDAFQAEVLRKAADEINELPEDYECDPGRGDAADLLRRRADELDTVSS